MRRIRAAAALFLAELTGRQVRVAAAHLDGFTQAETADALGVDQATVSRDLQAVRRACQRFGVSLPRPPRVYAERQEQFTHEVYDQLY